MKKDLVVCICSRGLVHSRTIEAVYRNLSKIKLSWEIVFTHDKPIPQAQNVAVERAKKYSPELLWFVEEDMVPPDTALAEMLVSSKGFDVVAAKYLLEGGTKSYKSSSGKLLLAGLGCLLVRLSVFDKIKYPYFNTNTEFDTGLKKTGTHQTEPYGQQDAYFFYQLKESDISRTLVNVRCKHLRVKNIGDYKNNHGCHTIVEI